MMAIGGFPDIFGHRAKDDSAGVGNGWRHAGEIKRKKTAFIAPKDV
ncbi:hypothetical protein [Acidithiobacillus caldus]|nr:hypothetical protein [Acidithiobacillus caldus]